MNEDQALLEQLDKAQLIALILELRAGLATQTARIQALEDQLAKHSGNSSKPPSSDGLKKPRTRSLREKGKRTSGGQAGHKGYTLELVATPDEIVRHAPAVCPQCQTDLQHIVPYERQRRQVFELPPQKLHITEHQALTKICPCCGEQVKGTFPAAITQRVQYGTHLKGYLVYLHTYQLLPLARLVELVQDSYGHTLSQGLVLTALAEAVEAVQPSMAAIEQQLVQAPVAHADETGMRVAGQTQWWHVLSTERLTRYLVHAKRGKQAMQALGLLERFRGWLQHDGLRGYLAFRDCDHALCNAHLLRELTFVEERYQQRWAQQLKELLLESKAAVAQARQAGAKALEETQQGQYRARYTALMQQGLNENPPAATQVGKRRVAQTPARRLLVRLQQHAHAVLAFMVDFRVAFDNNLAERDLRMIKVKQKIAGCFRTLQGAETFAVLRSYLSTVRKHGHGVIAALTDALRGQPFIPSPAT